MGTRKLSTDSGLRSTQPPLVVIVGETASGKSALAMQIAQKFNGEIITADSWQVYRGFDIGTAKPSEADQAAIPHHLLDIRDPSQGFSAAIYKKLAQAAVLDIASRGKFPILVGGTGLYIDAVLFDFSFMPVGKTKQRSELSKLTTQELLAQISQQGIDTTGIDTRNKRRLIRLIETNGQRPGRAARIRPNSLVIGLKIPRKTLRQQIENRTDNMFRRGLKHEVKKLANEYGWDAEPMKGIGYRQFQNYFEGKQSLAATKRQVIKATLELAKRQRTWFKRNRQIIWVENPAEAIKLVKDFLN